MTLTEDRIQELSRESDFYGEKAGQCLLEGLPEQALGYADRAVHAHDELWRLLQDDHRSQKASYVFAARLQDRAEIRRALCVAMTDGRRLGPVCRPAIDDCTRAIEMIRASGRPARGELPLWIPGVQLMRAEFHAWMDHAPAAKTDADDALARYRALQDPDSDDTGPSLANALSRQADLLWAVHERNAAVAVRREAVEIYRPHVGRGGALWARRYDQGIAWATTPTLERFCRTAFRLGEQQEPPRASVAGDVLLALQDAAEGYAELVPVHTYPQHAQSEAMARFTASVVTLQRWLDTLSEQSLARRYQQWFQACVPRSSHDTQWAEPVRRLRTDLEATAARYRQGSPED